MDHSHDPLSDPSRLRALRRTGLLDTPPDEALDRLTRLASRLLRVPVSQVSLVDAGRQFFASAVGVAEPWATSRQTPLSHSFCRYVVQGREPLVVEDARRHPLLRDNPAIPDMGVVAYAGFPLVTREGEVLGSFCVIDHQARQWTEEDLETLRDLAAAASTAVDLRLDLERRRAAEAVAAEVEERYRTLADATFEMVLVGEGGRIVDCNENAVRALGYAREELVGMTGAELVAPHAWPAVQEAAARASEEPYETVLLRRDGGEVPVEIRTRNLPLGGRMLRVSAIRDVSAQRLAQRALQRERDFAVQVMAAMGQGLLVTDERGTIDYANAAVTRIVGSGPQELEGKPVTALLPPGEAAWAQGLMGRLRAGESAAREMPLLRADGRPVHVLANVAPRFDGERFVGAITVLSDLTERTRMEQALRSSEARLMAVLQSLGEGLLITDLEDVVLYANPQAQAITGYAPEEIVGRRAADLYQARSELSIQEHHAERAAGLSATYESTIRTQGGEERVVEVRATPYRDADGTVIGTIGAFTDVTERRRTEQALVESERRYRNLIEAAGDIIYETDAEGRFTYANPAALRIMGYSVQHVVGKHYSSLMRPDYHAAAAEVYGRQVREQTPITYFEFPAVTREGGEVWIGQNVQIIVRGGKVTGLHAVARDVTSRREVERLKSEFISVVSHELRTPLTSIRGSLGLLASGRLPAEQGQRMLDVAVQNTDRLIRLINEILDIERLESGQAPLAVRPSQVSAMVNDAVAAVHGMAERAGVPVTAVAEDAVIPADADRVVQTLVNLLGNAVKFSSPGAPVSVHASREGDEFVFAVRDRGRGIPPDKLSTIFERFQQVDSSDARKLGGTGLGLSISRAIVEQHGGRIWVESPPGEGSSFRFSLPAPRTAADGGREPEPASGAPPPRPAGAPCVLLVEDDPDLRAVLSAQLQAYGVLTRQAGTVEQAWECAESTRVDLVVLDLMLPGGSGFDLAARMRADERFRGVSLVVYSVMDLTAPQRDQLRLGATVHLTKSRSTPEELADTVLGMLGMPRPTA